MKPRVVITLGDPAGIGPEIVSKALEEGRVLAACEPIVVGDPLALALHHQALPRVEMLSVPGLNKQLRLGKPSKEAGIAAIRSLRQAAGLIEARQARALITAPASKISFQLAGLPYPGHTEFLLKEYGEGPGAMLMVACPPKKPALRAILMTRHVPLSKVSKQLHQEDVLQAGNYAYEFVHQVLKYKKPRLALCGLNPHAGDGGLLGNEEETILNPAADALRGRGINVAGPLPADSVFRDMARGRYDVALAAYHDQGMIPLKLYAPDRLVNITLGLPFVRTSPGHGTAYDIAGQGRADPRPMIEAILLAAQYAG